MLMIGTWAGGSNGPPRAPVILASIREDGRCSNRRIIRLSPVVVRPPLTPSPAPPPCFDIGDASSAVAAAAPLYSDGPAAAALPAVGRRCISMPGRRGSQPPMCGTVICGPIKEAEVEAMLGVMLVRAVAVPSLPPSAAASERRAKPRTCCRIQAVSTVDSDSESRGPEILVI